MTWTSFRLLPCLAALAAFPCSPAGAADWRSYTADNVVHEIDADSVRIVGPLVRFTYRQHRTYTRDAYYDRLIEGVVDCKGRRFADYVPGKLELRPVYENTVSAYRLDAVCKVVAHVLAQHSEPGGSSRRDWKPYSSEGARGDIVSEIDAASLVARGRRVFFSYHSTDGASFGEVRESVVDCDTRQRADVDHGAFTLSDFAEGSTFATQADFACQLGGLPTAPRPPVSPAANWRVYDTGKISVMEIDVPSVRTEGGVVHFSYRTRFTVGTPVTEMEYPRDAVVDCAGRRRSDVVFDRIDWSAIEPGTPSARQLDLACGLAGASGSH